MNGVPVKVRRTCRICGYDLDLPIQLSERLLRRGAHQLLPVDEDRSHVAARPRQPPSDAQEQRAVSRTQVDQALDIETQSPPSQEARHGIDVAHQTVQPLKIPSRAYGVRIAGGQLIEPFGLDPTGERAWHRGIPERSESRDRLGGAHRARP